MPLHAGNRVFYIPSSDNKEIIKTLQDNKYSVTWIDEIILSINKSPKEGWYSVKPIEYGRFMFFKHLHKQETKKTKSIVIYAGETKEELTKRLARDTGLSVKKLLKSYKSLAYFRDGDIIAVRYTIASKADENTTMKYLFKQSREQVKNLKKQYLDSNTTLSEIKRLHIIASIIQKESNDIKEMPDISSVIQNRLKKNMKLQMDGTLNYGKYSHTRVTPQRIREDKSVYNTYLHKGLPPHPISTVTLDALKASIQPNKTKYLYFMLNKKGKHDFSSSYKKHVQNIKVFRKNQKTKKIKKSLKLNLGGDIKIDWGSVGI